MNGWAIEYNRDRIVESLHFPILKFQNENTL